MKYFFVEPEVAGGLGPETIMDRSIHPPKVSKLHYVFDGWLGDSLLTTFPCFIATDEVRQRLQATDVSGVSFTDVTITTSDEFKELHPGRRIPKFFWLQISGKPGDDDFGNTANAMLVVSQRALDVLNTLGIGNAIVRPY